MKTGWQEEQASPRADWRCMWTACGLVCVVMKMMMLMEMMILMVIAGDISRVEVCVDGLWFSVCGDEDDDGDGHCR